MENEKNEMKKKPGKVLPWLAAVLLAAALAARAAVPVPAGLFMQIWNIGTQLIILFSGLVLFSAAARAVFQRVSPSSNHGKTVFTLADSAIRYLLIIVGLLWALSIVGVDVRALLAGAGVLALIIGFGAESLIADVITGTFMLFEHQYEVGDIIVVGDFRGTVTQIGIRTTQIMDSGGNVKIINNSDIRSLINRSNDLSFAVCDMAVPYDKESLARAEKVLGEVLPKLHREHPDLFSKAPAYLGVQTLDYENRAVVIRVAGETHEENIYKAQRLLNRTLFPAEAGVLRAAAGVGRAGERDIPRRHRAAAEEAPQSSGHAGGRGRGGGHRPVVLGRRRDGQHAPRRADGGAVRLSGRGQRGAAGGGHPRSGGAGAGSHDAAALRGGHRTVLLRRAAALRRFLQRYGAQGRALYLLPGHRL